MATAIVRRALPELNDLKNTVGSGFSYNTASRFWQLQRRAALSIRDYELVMGGGAYLLTPELHHSRLCRQCCTVRQLHIELLQLRILNQS